MFTGRKLALLYQYKCQILDELNEARDQGQLDEPCNVSMLFDWVLVGYLAMMLDFRQHQTYSKLSQSFIAHCAKKDAGPFANNQEDNLKRFYNTAENVMIDSHSKKTENPLETFMDAASTQFLTDAKWNVSDRNKQMISDLLVLFNWNIKDFVG